MVLKGLPDSCKSFVVVITQSDKQLTFSQFKTSLRNFSDTESSRSTNQSNASSTDHVMKTDHKNTLKCFVCKKEGHFRRDCRVRFCTYCKKRGHTLVICRKNQGSTDTSVSSAKDESENHFAFKIDSTNSSCLPMQNFMVDTGATSHIVNDKCCSRYSLSTSLLLLLFVNICLIFTTLNRGAT